MRISENYWNSRTDQGPESNQHILFLYNSSTRNIVHASVRSRVFILFARLRRTNSGKRRKQTSSLLPSDAQITYSMLEFCSGELRTDSEIMSYCRIDQKEFFRFLDHCYKMRLLRTVLSKGLPHLVTTELGEGVLMATKTIIRELETHSHN